MAGFQKSLFTLRLFLATMVAATLVATSTATADRFDLLTGFSFGGALSGDGNIFSYTPSCGPAADCGFSQAILNLGTNKYFSVDERFDLSSVSELSFDGSVVVGQHRGKPSVWTPDGMQILAEPLDPDPWENGVSASSADGSIVGGKLNNKPALWINGKQQLLPDALRVRHGHISGLSGDGRIFVGEARTESSVAIVSTLESTRVLETPEDFLWSSATGVSADGTTVLGFHHAVDAEGEPFRVGFLWSEEAGMVRLDTMVPTSASADGKVVVGDTSPYPRTFRSAKIWDATNGVRNIRDVYAKEIEAVDANLELQELTDMSEDGRTIVGTSYSNFAEAAWILHIGDFEACDLNADGACDAVDIDGFQAYLSNDRPFFLRNNSAYDLNSDDEIDAADLRQLLDLMDVVPGDTDLDGFVDMADFLTLSAHFGEEGGWESGDFNSSGRVDFRDFLYLSSNFGAITIPVAVPEPAQDLFLLFVAIACWHLRRQRD